MNTHFAKLGVNGKVISVHTVSLEDCKTQDGVVDEKIGQEFLEKLHGWPGPMWIRTFKDRSQRKNYAGIGYTYDEERDAFLLPKPHPSWILNETTCLWDPPIPRPESSTDVDGVQIADIYGWNELTKSWDNEGPPRFLLNP